MGAPIVLRGKLDWANRKEGLEAYGAGGRWCGAARTIDPGDLLGDALERAGATEGSTLLVIAVSRSDDIALLDDVQRLVASKG